MIALTAEQSRQADTLAIQERGISAAALMEKAAAGAFQVLRRCFPDLSAKKIVIVAGKGNNGGDGRVLARLLKEVAKEVRVLDVGAGFPRPGAGTAPLQDVDILIDAIFGTGLSRPVDGVPKDAIEAINRSGKWVMALDVPSGLSADTGETLGAVVKVDVTVTMGRPKVGLLESRASAYVGRLEIVDIGIPAAIYESLKSSVEWVTAGDLKPWFRPRDRESHKGTYGHALLIGGSESKPGSILLAGKAALRTGAGLATVLLPDKAFRKFPKNFLELMYEPAPSTRGGTLARGAWAKIAKAVEGKAAVALGPGMGANADSRALVRQAVLKIDRPLVLDADALNVLNPEDLKKRKGATILTPHPGEMSRMTGLSTAKIQKDRRGAGLGFAKRYGAIVVLKGHRTVTATPSGKAYVNSTGNPGMAVAGMGDVLTGVIVSLISQGLEPERAAVASVFLHGRAGDRVAERLGDRGLLASDVIDEIPQAIREIL